MEIICKSAQRYYNVFVEPMVCKKQTSHSFKKDWKYEVPYIPPLIFHVETSSIWEITKRINNRLISPPVSLFGCCLYLSNRGRRPPSIFLLKISECPFQFILKSSSFIFTRCIYLDVPLLSCFFNSFVSVICTFFSLAYIFRARHTTSFGLSAITLYKTIRYCQLLRSLLVAPFLHIRGHL